MEHKLQRNLNFSHRPVKRNAIYGVGIDVHKHNLTAAITEKRFDAIRIIKVQPFTTDDTGYAQFWAFVAKYQPKMFVFEASGVYSTYFHEFLDKKNRTSGLNAMVVRLNPRVAKQMHFTSTNHTDPVDAKSLAIIAVMGIAKPFYGLEANQRKVKELTRTHLRYGHDCTRIKNRIKRLLDHSGIYLRKLDLNSIWGCYFVEAMATKKGTVSDAIKTVLLNKQVPSISKKALEKRVTSWGKYQSRCLEPEYQELLDMLVVRLVFLNKCTTQVEHLLNNLIESDPHLQKQVSYITSVPGLSVISALSILSEIRDIRLFKTYRNLLNYAGLAPTIHASGELSRSGRTNRKSNKFLRTAFYQAGVSIATTVKERSDLKDFAGRLLARYGKRNKRVYIKVAVKVARIVYALLKKGEWYNPFHECRENTGELDGKSKVISIKVKSKKSSLRKMANWVIRKKDYLPTDVLTRMRKVLEIEKRKKY
jgi:transposase